MTHYVVQSVQLRRDKFSKGEAYKWVREHGFSANKIDVSPHFYRFRQQDPDRLQGGRFRQIKFGDVAEATIVYF